MEEMLLQRKQIAEKKKQKGDKQGIAKNWTGLLYKIKNNNYLRVFSLQSTFRRF
jgi:hypothetical protein